MNVLYGNVITDGKIYNDFYIGIEKEKIVYAQKEAPLKAGAFRKIEGYICPGFIDQHIHGVDGYDFMNGQHAHAQIAVTLPKYGVTSFLATSRTSSKENIEVFLKTVQEQRQKQKGNCAEVLGAHIEGPWINHHYKGAQPAEYIKKFTKKTMKWLEPYMKDIRMITLAPEQLPDLRFIQDFHDNHITISAGHTKATMEEILKATAYGLRQITHTFNAMSPFHHREPGVAAAALYNENLQCELIGDGIHIHPKVIELLYKIKGFKKITLISDCTGYNHLKDGIHEMKERTIQKEGRRITLMSGALAGSAMTLGQIVKYVVEHCQIPIQEAVYMATQSPANMIKHANKIGRIAEGFQADLTILNEDLTIQETIKKGKTLYKQDSPSDFSY